MVRNDRIEIRRVSGAWAPKSAASILSAGARRRDGGDVAAAWMEHQVLFYPGQKLTDADPTLHRLFRPVRHGAVRRWLSTDHPNVLR